MADLFLRCVSRKPAERPTAAEILDHLSMHSTPSRSTGSTLCKRLPSASHNSSEEVRTCACFPGDESHCCGASGQQLPQSRKPNVGNAAMCAVLCISETHFFLQVTASGSGQEVSVSERTEQASREDCACCYITVYFWFFYRFCEAFDLQVHVRAGSILIAAFDLEKSSKEARAAEEMVQELVMKGHCSLETATGSFILYITFRQADIRINELADYLARNGAELSFIADPAGQAGFFSSETKGMLMDFSQAR